MASRREGFDAFPEVDRAELRARIDARAAERVVEPRRGRVARAVMWSAAPLAAAAALLLSVHHASKDPIVPPGGSTSEELGTAREKGGAVLHVFREVGGRSDEVVSGSRLAPGDRIRFVVDLPSAGAIKIVGVEASGNLYDAWPMVGQATETTQRPAGVGQELPGAVALDASHGREVLYLVHCAGAKEAPACDRGSDKATDKASDKGTSAPRCPAGCALSPFVMEKP